MDIEISVMYSTQSESLQAKEAGGDKGGTGSPLGGLQACSDARPGFSMSVRQHTPTALSSEVYSKYRSKVNSRHRKKIKTNIVNMLGKK